MKKEEHHFENLVHTSDSHYTIVNVDEDSIHVFRTKKRAIEYLEKLADEMSLENFINEIEDHNILVFKGQSIGISYDQKIQVILD